MKTPTRNAISEYRIHVDKVRAGYTQEDASGSTPISPSTYTFLGMLFRKLVEENVRVPVSEGNWLSLIPTRAATKRKRAHALDGDAAAEIGSPLRECFLVWSGVGVDERRMYVGLVASDEGSEAVYYLNQDYNPAKFLTGQNAFGPHPDTTWLGRQVTHTPAGYMTFAYSLLGLYLHAGGAMIGRPCNLQRLVDRSATVWSRIDLVDLVEMRTKEDRDRMLRVLNCTARLNLLITRKGLQKNLTLRYLFGLEAMTVMPGYETPAPTLTLKRWLPHNARTGKHGAVAYTLNLYAKDRELADTGRSADFLSYPPAYQEALTRGIRIELQLTPEAFRIPEVRAFCVEQGWLPAGEGRPQNVQSTLRVLFPDYDTYLKRSTVLARFLWQESCFALVMAPPDLSDILEWAETEDELVQLVVREWVGDPKSPRDQPLPHDRQFHQEHRCGSRAEVRAAYQAIEARWKFKLTRVPAVAFPLLIQQMAYGLADNDTQVKLAVLHAALIRCEQFKLEAQQRGDEHILMECKRDERDLIRQRDALMQESTSRGAFELQEFRRLVHHLKPNNHRTIAVNTRTTKRKEPA